MEAISEPFYFLSAHAHVCVLRDRVVLLDVISGKYLSLDSGAAASLRGRVTGWPELQVPKRESTALELLSKQGLITLDRQRGKSAKPVMIEPPVGWLGEQRLRGCPDMSAIQVWRFFRSSVMAIASLRLLRLQAVVNRVSSRKAANRTRAKSDLTRVAELSRIFEWLRPLAFEKKNECFLYCLALADFLATYDVYPDWVFAVRENPFSAHCWLQLEGQMLTDIPFGVRELTPIMVV